MNSPTPQTRPRAAMPHVVTQWQSGQPSWERRDEIRPPKLSTPSHHPNPSPLRSRHRSQGNLKQRPSPALPATPERGKWDFASTKPMWQYQDQDTPTSTVESVFELPSGTTRSPNSSRNSLFVAELEDTSPLAVRKQRSTFPATSKPQESRNGNATMEFRSVELTVSFLFSRLSTYCTELTIFQSRAVIAVIDETIAAIELDSRTNLSRAVAAEEEAQLLREENRALQNRIFQCTEHHERPKTAPSQPIRNRAQDIKEFKKEKLTPLSAFNRGVDRLVLNKPLPPPLPRGSPSFALPTHNSQAQYSHSTSQPSRTHFGPSPSTTFTAPSNFSNRPMGYRRPPPPPLLPPHPLYSTNSGIPRKSITLEESRLKPLPPLGPMSPSILRGVVEIGPPMERGLKTNECGVGREAAGLDENGNQREKKRRGFSSLFGWTRKGG